MKKMLIVISVLSCLFLVGNVFGQSVSGSKSDADANSQSGVLIDNSHQSSKVTNNDRKLVQGVPVMAGTNGFFTSPTPDSSFKSIKDILRAFGDGTTLRITEGALENMAKGGDVESHLQIIRGSDAVPRIYTSDFKDTKWLTIAIEKPIFGKNGFNAYGKEVNSGYGNNSDDIEATIDEQSIINDRSSIWSIVSI